MARTKKKIIQSTQKNFSKQFEELEKIVEVFEQSSVDLDTGLKEFERGLKIAAELKKTLENVENKIETLRGQYRLGE